MGVGRDRLLASMPDEVPPAGLEAYRSLVRRRASGEAVAYILGYKEFYGRRFAVDQRVLVPRPDSELLVELALSLLPARDMARAGGSGGYGGSGGSGAADRAGVATGASVAGAAEETRRVLCHDAFTGSGCVGISLAAERPDIDMRLSDISAGALELARRNARDILGRELDARQGNILSAAEAPLDLVTANPPYVLSALADQILAGGSREPRLALDGGGQGLDLYPVIAAQAFGLLRDGGALALETGDEQGNAVAAMLGAAGFSDIGVHKDLAGHDRVVTGVKRAAR